MRLPYDPNQNEGEFDQLIDQAQLHSYEIDKEDKSYFEDNTDLDIFGDKKDNDGCNFETFTVTPLMTDEEYSQRVNQMNTGQRKYFDHAAENIKSGKVFYEFVSGGAGVGKLCSHAVLKLLYLIDFNTVHFFIFWLLNPI